jgi:MerR family transcriptional regulator, copper efflux regulator
MAPDGADVGGACGDAARYFVGSMTNFSRQSPEQKKNGACAYSALCLAVTGSTDMPQTGSFASALVVSAELIGKWCLCSISGRDKPSHDRKVKWIRNVNIGAAAAASGVTAKMIRHYEAIGLLRPAERRANDYRDYGERNLHELRFIKRARRLGFSIAEIGELLALWRDRGRPSREVKRIAEAHIGDLQSRVAEMQAMTKTLRGLAAACHGDDRPDCPILDDLAS